MSTPFREILDLVPDPALLRRRRDGVIVEANAGFASFVERDPEELVGVRLEELEVSFRGDERREYLRRLDERGRVESFPLRIRFGADGEREAVHLLSSRVVELDGESYVLSVSKDITDRTEAEKELRTSRERYRTLFRLSRDGIFVVDDSATILEVNERAAELTGYPSDELVGASVLDLHPPEVRPDARAAIERTLEVGGGQFDLPFRRPDGEEWLGQIAASGLRVDDRPLLQAMVRDVTEQVEARRDAEKQRARLNRILETTTEGILMTDAEGNFRYANPAAEEMLGLERSDIEERTYDDPRWRICAPDGGPFPDHELPVARVLREGEDVQAVEHGVVRPDGHRVVLSVNAAPLADSEGEVTGVVASIRDVTEEKRRERRLRRSERRYRYLFEHNVAGTFRTSLDGEILECNPAFARMLGFDAPEELIGREAGELYASSEDRGAWMERLQEQGHLAGAELKLERRDGEPLWVMENSFLIEDPEIGAPVNMGTLVDITDQKEHEKQLRHRAYHDTLTGLANRRLLEHQAERALREADRRDERVGLLFVDLRRFKRVNDSFGHQTGDRVLARVAGRIAGCVRGADLCARVGGDEFAVLLSGLEDVEDARRAADRLDGCFEQPFEVEGETLHMRARIGAAVYPDHASNVSRLLSHAGHAMHEADPAGGEAVEMYRPLVREEAADEVSREELLRRALADDELSLHYQPIYPVGEDGLVGAEGLVRWERRDAHDVRAAQLIPVAERTGLVRELDRVVLRTAVRQVDRWSADGAGAGWISVNLSAGTLSDPELPGYVASLLEARGVEGGQLLVEITERVAMRDPRAAAETLQALQELGVRVAIDDYGTGHAVLAYLKHFQAHVLKLDMLFVQRLGQEARDERLLNGVVTLAHELDMEVIAEGVETPEQLEALERIGADFAQGYHLGRPVPPGELV